MSALPTNQLPRLHLKPVHDKILFTQQVPQGTLTLRSLHLTTDLEIIYGWVNRSYSRRFWQMNGTPELVKETYEMILYNPNAHSFILHLDGAPVAQIDVYQVLADELQQHIEATENDCGLHLLLLPPRQSKKGLPLAILRAFMAWYFSFEQSTTLYAEPDSENAVANLLAVKAGFQFLKTIRLSYKTAHLYSITNNQFQCNV